jgi:hypothetical protein
MRSFIAFLLLSASLGAATVVRFQSGEAVLADGARPFPGGSGRVLALAVTRPTEDARLFRARAVPVLGALPGQTFLVWVDARQWADLAAVPGVKALAPLEAAWKRGPLGGGDRYRCLKVVEAPSPRLETRHLTLRPGQVEAFLKRADIAYLESAAELTLRNDATSWVVQSNQPEVRPLHDNGLTGEGEVVGHLDGPPWIDTCYLSDPGREPGPDHRKIAGYRSRSGYGRDGHGTHTAGTAVGYADGQPDNGIAYGARLSTGSVYDITGWDNTESNLYDAFLAAHADGARVHTNSWGEDAYKSYTAFCYDIDRYMRENPEDLVVFSATNYGDLRSPENAKNCLSVGGSFQAPQQERICTGGHGPTQDGRLKPEIFVPGCSIQSASSVQPCGTASMSGTSMASPAVTAAAALAREYYRRGYYPSGSPVEGDGFVPSGALLKATLINGGQDMTGVDGYPNPYEGWGRLQADRVLRFPGSPHGLRVEDIPAAEGLSTGGVREFSLTVQSPGVPLKVTLVWIDEPGLPVSGDRWLINDLDLEVTDASGALYYGNAIEDGASLSAAQGGTPDRLNTVEAVILPSPAPGTVTVRVRGADVPVPAQGFALVATGDLTEALAYRLPVVARAPGANGSLWRTDLWVFNPGAAEQAVSLEWVPSGGGTPAASALTLQAMEARTLDDPLLSLFGAAEGVGAVTMRSSGPLAVTARIVNTASGATYGQGYSAFTETFASGDTVYLPGLFLDGERRTNLGLAAYGDPDGAPVTAALTLYDTLGTVLGTAAVTLPASWHEQNVLQHYFPQVQALHNGTLAVAVTGMKGLFPYASVVTASTGDGVFIAPRKAAEGTTLLPVLASAPNPTGAAWKTEISLFSPPGGDFEAVFRVNDGTGWADRAVSFTLGAGASHYAGDFLQGLGLSGGIGYLVFDGPFVPAARVWSGASQGESMGQFIPALGAAGASAHHWLPGYLPGAAFRLNLGIENLEAGDAFCQAVLWSAAHEKLGESILGCPGEGLVQQNAETVFGPLPTGEAGVIELACDGPVFAYVSLVDGTTSDATLFTD